MKSFRFCKDDRLLSSLDFLNLRQDSNVFHGKVIRVFYSKIEKDSKPRIGLSVSSKIGNSVTRNRFKRLARESFRLNKLFLKNVDFNVVPLRPRVELEHQKEYLFLEDLKKFYKVISR